jgi:hypothetical protein
MGAFMRFMAVFVGSALVICFATDGLGAGKKKVSAPAPENPACAGLTRDYDSTNKLLAMNTVEGIGDNSAIRATMRETQNGNALEKARMTLDLMKGNGCKLPTSAPGGSRYMSAALDCEKAKLDQTLARQAQGYRSWDLRNMPPPPSECDMANWRPADATAPAQQSLPVSTVHTLVPQDQPTAPTIDGPGNAMNERLRASRPTDSLNAVP